MIRKVCDNEQRSVELFDLAARSHFQQDFVNKVGELILATAHRGAPHNHDERVLCDIDFASFGSPWDEFLSDSQALRIEQAKTPDELFYPAKLKFLKAILERRTIFLRIPSALATKPRQEKISSVTLPTWKPRRTSERSTSDYSND